MRLGQSAVKHKKLTYCIVKSDAVAVARWIPVKRSPTRWFNNGVLGWALSGEEALVFDPALPPVGDNVNITTLKTIAVPYPQVISGTPNSWSFANGTFQFSYSTDRADGSGSFPAGSQTTISVPAVEFPDGYQVSVNGGHVVSAPNAPELVIASGAGATTISVVVSAAADGVGAGMNAV